MSTKQQLEALENEHLSPSTRESREKLDRILADDFWEIGSSGLPYNKKICLDEGVVLADMTLHHYEIEHLAEDVVLASYYVEDKTRNRKTLRSSIWKWIDGRWQLSFHQGTPTQLQIHEYKKMNN